MNYILFLIFILLSLNYLFKGFGIISNPINKDVRLKCTGLELLWIFIFSTGMFALSASAGLDLSAIRLMALEIFCILGFLYCKNNPVFSIPLVLYLIYLLWILIGLSYTPNPSFGIRVILKYLYPFLLALFTAIVIRDKEVVVKGINFARVIAFISILFLTLPLFTKIFPGLFWAKPAAATHYISMVVISFAFALYTNENKKNIIWTIIFCIPCFYWVYRTNILGTAVALSAFAFIKYRLKSLPIIAFVGILGLFSMFYIPSVKAKMFINPDEVTMDQYLSGQVSENNINTSGRNYLWEVKDLFYNNNEILGSGTGRVQTYFYTEMTGWGRGGQVHNDFLQIMCDNGLIGLILYIIAVLAIYIHCIIIYDRKNIHPVIKIFAISAGSSLLGVATTMYSDNTVSYSMATLAYPWAFYGITLGLLNNSKNYIKYD